MLLLLLLLRMNGSEFLLSVRHDQHKKPSQSATKKQSDTKIRT